MAKDRIVFVLRICCMWSIKAKTQACYIFIAMGTSSSAAGKRVILSSHDILCSIRIDHEPLIPKREQATREGPVAIRFVPDKVFHEATEPARKRRKEERARKEAKRKKREQRKRRMGGQAFAGARGDDKYEELHLHQ